MLDVAATPRLSFVIPVRNDARNLRVCLASILAAIPDGLDVEILVGDNGSVDDSAQVASAAGARVLTLPGVTVAGIRNIAAREARGDVLAFVDADHALEPGWAGAALAAMEQPGVVAAGAPYHPPAGGTWVQRMYDAFRDHRETPTDVEWLGSGNLVVSRQAFAQAGGFDTRLLTCEDVDLCQRLRQRGGRIVDVPAMRTTHFGDPATLKALFFGELWRGHDNLKTSLRSTPTLRGLPSIAIPVVNLALVATALVGLATAFNGGAVAAGLAVAGTALLASLRALVMVRRLGTRSAVEAVRALAVAVTYDLARALAPLWPGPHAARRRAEAR